MNNQNFPLVLVSIVAAFAIGAMLFSGVSSPLPANSQYGFATLAGLKTGGDTEIITKPPRVMYTCTDSDGGNNTTTYGSVSIVNTATGASVNYDADYCLSWDQKIALQGYAVTEQTCDPNYVTGIIGNIVSCANGCVKGRCISEIENPLKKYSWYKGAWISKGKDFIITDKTTGAKTTMIFDEFRVNANEPEIEIQVYGSTAIIVSAQASEAGFLQFKMIYHGRDYIGFYNYATDKVTIENAVPA